MQTSEVSLPAKASNTKTQRLTVIDMVRGITILLVVIGHADFTPIVLNDLFRDFRMPLFFMVSGYIFSASKYFNNLRLLIRTRLFSLVLPYFSAGILAYLIWAILQAITKDQWDIVWYKPLLAIVYGTSLEGSLINVPIWFLTCLFVTQIIFCIVMRYVNPFCWPFQLGIMLKEYQLIEKLRTFNVRSFILLLLFLLTAYFNSYVDMNNRIYGNVLLFYVAGITGSILVLNFLEQTIFHLHLNWLITTIIAVSGSLLFNLLVRQIPLLHFLLNGKRTPARPRPQALWSVV